MQKQSPLLIITIIILLISCNSGKRKSYLNDNNLLVEEQWYSKGNLKSRTIYLNEEKSDYRYMSYYENGRMWDSALYKNGQFHKARKYYDQANDLLHFETYNEGIFNGPHKAIYGNGVASFSGYHAQGSKVGEWKFHHPEGNPITYEFYDSSGRIQFFVKYDYRGLLEKTEGSGIINISDFNKKKNLEYKFEIIIAVPQNCTSVLKIREKSMPKGNHLVDTQIHTPRNTLVLNFSSPGEKNMIIELFLSDNNSGFEKIYTTQKKLNIPRS